MAVSPPRCSPRPFLPFNINFIPGDSCQGIADDYSITVNQITTWNPWVLPDCNTGLYTGLDSDSDSQNAICIGVNSTAPTSTATPGPSTTTSTGATMGPTQSGIIASCTKFYTMVENDSCASIEAIFAITFQQFYAWNPAGKSYPLPFSSSSPFIMN